jgi:hypothetical protein
VRRDGLFDPLTQSRAALAPLLVAHHRDEASKCTVEEVLDPGVESRVSLQLVIRGARLGSMSMGRRLVG